MKYLKLFGIAVLQSVLMYLINTFAFLQYINSLADDSSAAIGIIGGADGPTAIFTASRFSGGYSNMVMELTYIILFLFFIANLASQVKDKVLSVMILVSCCLLTVSDLFIYFTFGTVLVVLINLALIVGGYFLSRKIRR